MTATRLGPIQEAKAEVLPPPGNGSALTGLRPPCLLSGCSLLLEEAAEMGLELCCRLVHGGCCGLQCQQCSGQARVESAHCLIQRVFKRRAARGDGRRNSMFARRIGFCRRFRNDGSRWDTELRAMIQ